MVCESRVAGRENLDFPSRCFALPNLSDYATRIAHGQRMGRNVFGYYTASSYYATITYRHTRQHTDVGPNPHIVAHSDGVGILQPPVSQFDIERMTRSIKPAVWSNEDVVSKPYFRTIENHHVDV